MMISTVVITYLVYMSSVLYELICSYTTHWNAAG